jgi:hypothetical protein
LEVFTVKKISSIRLVSLALFFIFSAGIAQQSVLAQDSVTVQATPFYRFITQNATLGHFLTANFSEGTGYPYNYAYQPFPYQADIVVGPAGYNPRPGQGLLPLYRWQVDQRPRIYYYYSTVYANHGSNYRFQGLAGWVLPADGSRGGTPLNFWYSQSYGYYYTLNGEYPPCCTFSYHGVPFNLPQGGSYIFDRPPDPCAGMEQERENCELNGNIWNNSTCTCQISNPCGPSLRICDQGPADY